MKKQSTYLLILFLSIVFVPALGQNVKKKYSSRGNGNQSVFFIHPLKGFKSDLKKGELTYDITYNTGKKDSATYNFTFYHTDPYPIDSIAYQYKGARIVLPATMLYLEPEKKYWKHRTSVIIPYKKLEEYYTDETISYKITLYSKATSIEYIIREKEWKKQSATVRKIMQIIEHN